MNEAIYHCPACHANLSSMKGDAGIYWVCHVCGGRAVTIASLRRIILAERVNEMWQAAKSPGAPQLRDCPMCSARMMLTRLPEIEADVCIRCHAVWFDAHEYERMPKLPPVKQASFMASLPLEARERIATIELAVSAERHARETEQGGPDEFWKYVPAFLGLPVEYSSTLSTREKPWITWGFSAVIGVVSLLAFEDSTPLVFERFGLIPAERLRMGGLTFATSAFIHADFVHLLSNLYFLMVFGDNVEHTLGRRRYLMLICAATLAGGIAHVAGNPNSTTPCVGASGFISGILAYYALKFPHARVGLMLHFFVRVKWVKFSARFMFAAWLILQLYGIRLQYQGLSQVSALAHVGGVAAGAAFWALEKRRVKNNDDFSMYTK